MITVSVTSDSSTHELHLVSQLIDGIIENNTRNAEIKRESEIQGCNPSHVIVDETFNATELAEAEALGKSAHSTVDANQSSTAHADIQVNTSLPAPTSVFGQTAQTTVNVANPVAPPTDNPVRDADGLVWDGRIHSSSKETVKDGTWRKRRGVSDELVKQVEAELRGERHDISDLMTETGYVPVTPTATELPSTLQPVTHIDVTSLTNDGKAIDMTFTELLDGVTKAMVAGQLSQQRINEALASVGLTALPHLLGNPQLIPSFRQALGGVV